MRPSFTLSLLVSLCLTASLCLAQQATDLVQPAAAPPAQATKFVSLFDGKNLDGWVVKGGTATYRVEDDTIVGTTVEGSRNTFLSTTRDYANFELRFEVKCDPALNSGVQIRSRIYDKDTPQESKPDRIREQGEVFGYQCEIASNGTAGKFWDEGRRTKWLDEAEEDLGDEHPYKPGEWNKYRILADGDRIRSWVNGVERADFTDDRDASGFIGLQVHSIKKGTGPYEVRWRNLRIRDLSINPGINTSFLDPDVDTFVERFEREGREVYDNRERIVAACRITPGMTVADIGCGTGLFTRLLAQATGDEGRVFAVDIAPQFVQHVESDCREAGLTNVEGIVCQPNDVALPNDSIDVAFLCDTYHHFEFPHQTMASLHRALKPGGRVVLVDFHRIPGESSDWILSHMRAGQDTFVAEIQQCGFERLSEDDFLNENYLVVFARSSE